MKESPYWNPRHETMPRDQIEALQVRKLKNLVAWTQERVPWHAARLKAAGVTADSIRSHLPDGSNSDGSCSDQ